MLRTTQCDQVRGLENNTHSACACVAGNWSNIGTVSSGISLSLGQVDPKKELRFTIIASLRIWFHNFEYNRIADQSTDLESIRKKEESWIFDLLSNDLKLNVKCSDVFP